MLGRWVGAPLVLLSLLLAGCGGDDEGGNNQPKPNQPPVYKDPASLAMQQGRATNAFLVVSDPDGDPVTVTASPPAGIEASVVPTLILDAYADYTISGPQTIGFTLTDDKGASSEASIAADVTPLRWLERETWTTNGPTPREHGALVVDSAKKRILLFGGSGYSPQGTPLDDSWQFDLVAQTWSALTPSGDLPAAGGSRRVAPVPGQSIAYLFGGYGAGFANFDDLYRVDFSGDGAVFTKLGQSNPPPARSLHGFAFDAQTQRLFAFSGIGTVGATSAILGDLWTATIDGDAATWTEVVPDPAPSPRYGFFYGVDETRGRLLLFSGATKTSLPLDPARDTWALDLRADPPTWTLLLEGDAVPPGRRNGCFIMDPISPRLFVWGGTGDGATTEPSLFALDGRPGKEHWSTLDLADEPPLRSSGMGAYDPDTDRVWLGFGNDADVYRDFAAIGY